ncbi:MAG: helix-turn-helix transcriptional regulator [Bryobacteraceae bacterium]
MLENERLPVLPRTERIILELLVGGGKEMFGLELIEAAGGGLKRGSIYVTLQRMAQKGLVESREEARPRPEIGIPRRMYWATGFGARVLRAYEGAEASLALGGANALGGQW